MNALTPIDHPRYRTDGWSPDKQRAFLEGIARGLTVEQACRLVGMSPSSAYAFRQRAAGAAFALGWRAANLVAREHLADKLLARAIDGQVETMTRPDGSTISRHRYDNRLAVTMLARLDRQADEAPAPAHHAARLVAQDFEAFCEQIERDDAPARAGLFLGLRAAQEEADPDLAAMVQFARADRFRRTGASLAGEVEVADLDPAARAGWTAEQWLRAEAAGLVALAPAPAAPEVEEDAGGSPLSPLRAALAALAPADDGDAGDGEADEDEEELPVWEEDAGRWMTSLPPPPNFDGFEENEPGDPYYRRTLTDEEEAVVLQAKAEARDARTADGRVERDRWFRAAALGLIEPGEPADPDALDALDGDGNGLGGADADGADAGGVADGDGCDWG